MVCSEFAIQRRDHQHQPVSISLIRIENEVAKLSHQWDVSSYLNVSIDVKKKNSETIVNRRPNVLTCVHPNGTKRIKT